MQGELIVLFLVPPPHREELPLMQVVRLNFLRNCVVIFLTLPVSAAGKTPPAAKKPAVENSGSQNADFFSDETVLPVGNTQQTDEKGSLLEPHSNSGATPNSAGQTKVRPSYFTVGIGTRFVITDVRGMNDTRQFVYDNILRTNEAIYKSSGVTLAENYGAFHFEPALRAEWELPLEKFTWLNMLASFETGLSPAREIFSAAGNFRYQNAQATNLALTDLTYSGSLSVTERRFNITPMVGLGTEYTNNWLTGLNETHLLARVSLGAMLSSGERTYALRLNPQYVAAVSDTYVITADMAQSHTLSLLPAARAELGARARLSPRLHIALLLSVTAVFGTLGWENQGYFAERAGAASDKNIYQKVISGIEDQTHIGLAPAIFLALSTQI